MGAPTPDYDERDEFEQYYTARFLMLAARHAIPIRYETDKARLDLGLHLTTPKSSGKKGVTSSRIWFQFKGQSTKSLPLAKFEKADVVSEQVKVTDLRQWFRDGEAVYLVVYIEAIDKFFAVDIHKLIEERWGDLVFKDETFLKTDGTVQERVTVHLPKDTAEVNDAFWEFLRQHRSMRIDLGSYQGKPLPHDEDVQSNIPKMMDPEMFDDVVGRLLVAHRFEASATSDDVSTIYPEAATGGDRVTLMIGKLFDPFQYDHYLTRELVPDEEGYREDGQQFRAQGNVGVIIHSDVRTRPDPEGLAKLADQLSAKEIKNVLVFVNHYMTAAAKWDGKKPFNCLPEFSQGFAGTNIECIPMHLEDLGKQILLSPTVYFEFREDLEWLGDVVNAKIESGEYRVLSEDEYFEELRKLNKN